MSAPNNPLRLTSWLIATGAKLRIVARRKPAATTDFGIHVEACDIISIQGEEWGSDITLHLERAQTIELASALALLIAQQDAK